MAEHARRDRITLTNVKLRPRIGVTPGERRLPQSVLADVSLSGDFEAAASTDLLERTVNYSRVLDIVVEVAGSREFNLLETLAYHIGRQVLRTFPIDGVVVRLRKKPASIADKVDFIEVEVTLP